MTRTGRGADGVGSCRLAWLLLMPLLLPSGRAFSFTARPSAAALRTTVANERSVVDGSSGRRRPRSTGGVSSLRAVGVTSSVIETVAKGILNLALANPKQATVECSVTSSAMNLVRGNLDQAKVDG